MARPFSEASKEILLLLQNLGEIVISGRSMRDVVYILSTDREQRKSAEQARRYQRAAKRILKNRLVVLSENPDGTKRVRLTEKGKSKIRKFRFIDLAIPIPKHWDGTWRVVIFDVPVQKSPQRMMFTQKLQELGFAYLQKSVWVFPHPCFAELEFVAEELGIRKFVNFIEAKSIREDVTLKKNFHLL